MRLAIVGCGFVADFYAKTLTNHPELELLGAFDRDARRSQRFAASNRIREYASIEEVCRDSHVDIVLNLTNPDSHYAVSKAALTAGKHVYSEKPLSTAYSEAEELVELAAHNGLEIASAPCSVLGESAQTLWKALREQRIGTSASPTLSSTTDRFISWATRSGEAIRGRHGLTRTNSK